MAIRSPRHGISVARAMGSRAKSAGGNAAGHEAQPPIASMLENLRGLAERFTEALQQQAADPDATISSQTGEADITLGGKSGRMVFGYTLRIGADGVTAEPFGHVPAQRAQRSAAESAPLTRQPIVEISATADELIVIAELPGADPARLQTEITGQTLLIEAEGAWHYRKETALPYPVDGESLTSTFQNGILEVRLRRSPA